ncbi:MAG: S49 family peptidase [Phycisphaerales bacterium JB040]
MTNLRTLAGTIASALALPGMASAPLPVVQADSASVAVFEIEGTPAEMSAGTDWFGSSTQTLFNLVENLNTVAYDSEFAGVVIRLRDAALTTTQVEELSAAIANVRSNGKKVHVYSDVYGASDIQLAAASDGAILQAGGMVSLPGIYMEEMYLADALQWAGVNAQLIQVGDYKGANEQMTRSEPSPEWDQNISGLLDSLYENQRAALASGFGFTQDQLDSAYERAWWADGDTGISTGLIAAEVDLPEIRPWLAETYGVESVEWVTDPYTVSQQTLNTANPLALFSQLMAPPASRRATEPTVAVLHINGTIVDGDSTPGGGLLGAGQTTGSRTVRNAIEEIIKDDYIEGVVVRIDSPGGSAMASEVMWRGLQRLKEHKPVWVSVGSMAASGGYYTLVAGDKVYVNPSSIVGSIGVVGGKYSTDALYDKLKINTVARARGPRADLMSSSPWDESQQALIRSKMTETYDLFASRVAQGRPEADLSRVAEGRLFTGSDAIELHMADAIGGLEVAITDMAAGLGIAPDAVIHYPAPPSFEEMLENLFGGMVRAPGTTVAAPMLAPVREIMGPERFDALASQLNALTLLRDEPVLLVSPRAIHIR